jgi:hypothetical protein
MCLKWFKNLFHKKPGVTLPVLALTHPEEPVNYAQTKDNVDVGQFIDRWLNNYQVPAEFWDFWRTQIVITVVPDLTVNGAVVPAGTYDGPDGKRHLDIRPEWLNPGVIAHEQAHNSYALLSEVRKIAFSSLFSSFKETDPLIQFLFRQNGYGLKNEVEGHAEIYRYLAQQMPAVLKQFYPKLLEV